MTTPGWVSPSDDRWHPRPHQTAAIDAVLATFNAGQVRCQVVMACGTGKTLVGQRVAEKLAAGATLVLFPTLGLLDQTTKAWAAGTNRPYRVLAVCSDPKVGHSEDTPDEVGDESGVRVADLSVPVCSDPAKIVAWAAEEPSTATVVFCTYQSTDVIAAAHRVGLPAWDVVIADEAHRMAGDSDGLFATALHQRKIPAARRLFMTATPRVHGDRSTDTNVVLSMDDPHLFGPIAHQLTFPDAIGRGLLSDYQVAVVGVTSREVATFITENPALGDVDVKSVATQMATVIAVRQYRLRALLGFHNRVARSRMFTDTLPSVVAAMDADQRPPGPVTVTHIDSTLPTAQRREALQVLSRAHWGEGWAMVNNVRCLTEGIDVPILDGVVIAEPRSSTIEVTQAVGRAIRLNPLRNAESIILLPVFLTEHDNPEQILDESEFRHVYQTLRALQDHDDRLVAMFTQQRRALRQHPDSDPDLGNRVHVFLPDTLPAQLRRALSLRLIHRHASAFDVGLAELATYRNIHGDVNVPRRYITADGYQLGGWVIRTRRLRRQSTEPGQRTHGTLTPTQIQQLDELGFSWDMRTATWDAGVVHLEAYIAEHDTASVPLRHRDRTGFRLGAWVQSRRRDRIAGRLTEDRIAQLDRLGFVWDPIAAQWETGYQQLLEYHQRQGHSRVSVEYSTPAGFKLGLWCMVQRREYRNLATGRRSGLTPERISRLHQLGFLWEPEDDDWQANFTEWLQYRQAHGEAPIRADLITTRGVNLARWLDSQKKKIRNGTGPQRHRDQVNAILKLRPSSAGGDTKHP